MDAPMPGGPMIELYDVSLTYASKRANVEALGRISLSIEANTFVSCIGPTGCGKSSLLKLVAGLLAPSSGAIRVRGREVGEALRARAFGFVFQDATLLPWRTVLGNTILLMQVCGRPPAEREAAARRLLEMVGLAGFLHHYPRELSGGMKQRVAIARALTLDPDILLMDEPFAALDAITRDRMNLDLLRIWSQARKTVLFVTHGIAEAVFLSDRVLVMSARPGKVVADIPVGLPRPRSLDMVESPEFMACARQLRGLLAHGAVYEHSL
jgi:NitT/TauT family transport system ATP-binding protein